MNPASRGFGTSGVSSMLSRTSHRAGSAAAATPRASAANVRTLRITIRYVAGRVINMGCVLVYHRERSATRGPPRRSQLGVGAFCAMGSCPSPYQGGTS
jgi:hypothetical protein